MANSNGQKIANAGGPITNFGPKHPLCKAFAAAVEEMCPKGGKRAKGSFNPKFFKALRGVSSSLASEIRREVPFLLKFTGSGAARTLVPAVAATAQATAGEMSAMAAVAANPAAGVVATGLAAAVVAVARTGTYDAFRTAMYQAANWGGRFVPAFPDGWRNGQVIEIKGPGDSWRPGQKEKYEKLSAPNPVIEVSCESCGLQQKCHSGPAPISNGGCGPKPT